MASPVVVRETGGLSRWVVWIAEPRHITVAIAVLHLLGTAAGILGALPDEPITMQDLLNAVYGIPLALGGVLGVIAALRGWWYMERAALAMEGLAVLMRQALIVSVATTPPLETSSRVLMLAMLQVALIVRWLSIAGPALDPTR